MEVTAELDKVVTALQIGLPTPKSGFVAEVVIIRQLLGKLCVVAMIESG
jgi:hypothetical protein